MNDRFKNVPNSILKKFETGDIPEAIAYSMFPFPDVPSARWSLLYRTLQFLHGTMDARGIRQWNKVNRFVKKNTMAFYILVPYIKKIEDNGEEKQVLIGFGTKAVFKVEDTDGELLEYENIELKAQTEMMVLYYLESNFSFNFIILSCNGGLKSFL